MLASTTASRSAMCLHISSPAHVHRDQFDATKARRQTSRPESRAGGAETTTGVSEGQGCPSSTLVERNVGLGVSSTESVISNGIANVPAG